MPPNRSPSAELHDCGVGDFGGVSPVTDDHINPDYAWPEVRHLERLAAGVGKYLGDRLPVYPRYLDSSPDTDHAVGRK